MFFADVKGAGFALKVKKAAHDAVQKNRPIVLDAFANILPEQAKKELVESIAVPPSVHVGFPESKRSHGQRASIEFRIVDANIPRPGAVDFDIEFL